MLCCCLDSPKYAPVNTTEKGMSNSQLPPRGMGDYPGSSRSISSEQRPNDSVFIKSGGNALQAVPKSQVEQQNLVAVSVPENVNPGDLLTVLAPDGSGRVVQARVPDGALAGHTFLVQFAPAPIHVAVTGVPVDPQLAAKMNPTPPVAATTTTTAAVDVPPTATAKTGTTSTSTVSGGLTDLLLATETNAPTNQFNTNNVGDSSSNNNNNDRPMNEDGLILVRVPPGSSPGDKIRVRLPDQRLVDAVVPPGNVSEFYLKPPPKQQNWHDNPLAYGAPMLLGPALL